MSRLTSAKQLQKELDEQGSELSKLRRELNIATLAKVKAVADGDKYVTELEKTKQELQEMEEMRDELED